MFNQYPEELIEDIRINNDIVDVVSEYVKLDRKGKDYFGLCPFHKEKTPSFSVVPSKQIYYCFGCGKGGNVIHFVMNAENLDFLEAIRLLADRARIELPEGETEEEKKAVKIKQQVMKINVEAARFFHNELLSTTGDIARKYLQTRKIAEQTIRKFGIGCSTENWDKLFKYLLGKGFDEQSIHKSGLIITNKNGGYCDKFRERVMFPIFDLRGNVIGFGGRVMDASTPKYMNSPETCVYNKGRNLYALNFAKSSSEKKIIVVEGYMDVISLHQSGIINTVASLGTALTENQGRILKKYADEIIISYDADIAGQAATMRGLDLLNDIGCNVKVLIIPEGKDPDEFIKKNGAEAFKKLVENSLSLIEYKIKVLRKQINTENTEGKINFLNKTADILAKVDNLLEREMVIKKLSKEYEISEDSISSEIIKRTKPKTHFRTAVVSLDEYKNVKKATENKDAKLNHYEKMLLAFLCVDNSVYKGIKDIISLDHFSNEENRKAAEIALERLADNKGIVPGELLNILGNEFASVFTRIIQEECNCEDNHKAVLDILKRIEIFNLEKRQREILEILSINNGKVEGDVEKLKEELKSILLKKKGI